MHLRRNHPSLSIRRLASVFHEAPATVCRWLHPRKEVLEHTRFCPVSGDSALVEKVRQLCEEPRHETFGYRRIRALLRRRWKIHVSRKTVNRIMRNEGLSRPKIWRRPLRPKRVEKMSSGQPNHAWQMDMTSFQLSDLTALYLVVVIDCYTRQIVGWALDRRCRASEWVSALRIALETRGLTSRERCRSLTLRCDNGTQPCSKKFVEFLGTVGVRGQYTGYNAPDDNAFVERVIRTIKEEEIWLNLYDSVAEAHEAVEKYIDFYNQQRIHSALDYKTPNEINQIYITLKAA